MLAAVSENTGTGQPLEVDGRAAAIVPPAKLVESLMAFSLAEMPLFWWLKGGSLGLL